MEDNVFNIDTIKIGSVLRLSACGAKVERSPGVWEVVGSIPGWVIPKTLKMVLDAVKCDWVECYISVPKI